MIPRVPVTASNMVEWIRRAATTVNTMLRAIEQNGVTPFTSSLVAPSDPVEGQVVYRLDLHKPQYWNGSAWVDL